MRFLSRFVDSNDRELRRVQPIGGGVSVMLGVNRIRYNTDSAKFHGTGARVGLIFKR